MSCPWMLRHLKYHITCFLLNHKAAAPHIPFRYHPTEKKTMKTRCDHLGNKQGEVIGVVRVMLSAKGSGEAPSTRSITLTEIGFESPVFKTVNSL